MSSINVKQFPFYSLLLMAILLPFNWQLSLGVILLTLSVFFTQSFQITKTQLAKNKMYLLFSGTYALYLLAMWHTENQSFGMRDLEYKFSLFLLPIVLAALPKINKGQFKVIAKGFLFANIAAAIISFIVSFYRLDFERIPLYIDLAIFMHPSYFAAYLNLAFIFLVKLFRVDWTKKGLLWLFILLIAFIASFNILLNSKIGIIVNFLIGIVLIFQGRKWMSLKVVLSLAIATIFLFIILITQVKILKDRFQYLTEISSEKEIPKDTGDGTQLRLLIKGQVFEILEENFWIGVGTGDTKDALMEKYEINGIVYAYKNKLNTHNQLFEWLITFGVIGTVIYLISIFFPLIRSYNEGNYYYAYLIIPLLVYFVAESFLEREAGVLFFSFFNALLYFHSPRDERV